MLKTCFNKHIAEEVCSHYNQAHKLCPKDKLAFSLEQKSFFGIALPLPKFWGWASAFNNTVLFGTEHEHSFNFLFVFCTFAGTL